MATPTSLNSATTATLIMVPMVANGFASTALRLHQFVLCTVVLFTLYFLTASLHCASTSFYTFVMYQPFI
jgi:hypothetical protein